MATDADKVAKILVDPVYGTIHLDVLAVKIIDTKEFQRLRYIKQLSFADFVYPGATHTRFAHSIGVYHLACKMIKEIEAHDLPNGAGKMSTEDKRCIRVAALCHDLGHGPFSHLYEQIAEEFLDKNIVQKIKHEKISQFLVEKIFEDYDLREYLGPEPEKQIKLIKDLIERERDLTDEQNLKKYMFQIVSNKDSGVDVDKWDYFNRDAIACGVPERFQYDRAVSVARVVETKSGVFELGYRDYDAFNMYNMFSTRFSLYRKVYKHKVVQAVDLMIKDVYKLIRNADGQDSNHPSTNIDLYPITSTPDKTPTKSFMKLDDCNFLDVDKFLKLQDDVLLKICDSSKKYTEASDLMERLHERKLYKLFHDICVKVPQCDCAKIEAEKVPQCDCAKIEAEKVPQCDCAKIEAEKVPQCDCAKIEAEKVPQCDCAKIEAEKVPQCDCAKIEAEKVPQCDCAKIEAEKVPQCDCAKIEAEKVPQCDCAKIEAEKVPQCDCAKIEAEKVPQCDCAKIEAEKVPQCDCAKIEAEKVSQCECLKKEADKIQQSIESSLKNETDDIAKVVEVVLLRFDYGLKTKDPVRELYFYSKENCNKGETLKKDEVSLVLPNVFQEYHVRVYEKFSGNKTCESKVKTYRKTLKRIIETVKNSAGNLMPPSKKQKVDSSAPNME